uniref:Uncharacterized protein n=1 Tax=Romanomermis culicivorax TaxID=13658 RepID=A0A915IEY7_ROMCU
MPAKPALNTHIHFFIKDIHSTFLLVFAISKYYVNELKTTFKYWLIDRIARAIERFRFWVEERWSHLTDMAPNLHLETSPRKCYYAAFIPL